MLRHIQETERRSQIAKRFLTALLRALAVWAA
jgi:hypothetical protein